MPIGEPDKVRLDRWLWSVRIFKSRNLATEACKKNWVKLDGHPAKPSKEIKMGDVITIKLGPLQKIVSVVGLIEKRTSPAKAGNYVADLTPPEAYEKAKQARLHLAPRIVSKKGIGRPTKKQRRELDDFLYPESADE